MLSVSDGFTFSNFLADALAIFLFVVWLWLLITVTNSSGATTFPAGGRRRG